MKNICKIMLGICVALGVCLISSPTVLAHEGVDYEKIVFLEKLLKI